jgi:riboflavin synthase alpha subunit
VTVATVPVNARTGRSVVGVGASVVVVGGCVVVVEVDDDVVVVDMVEVLVERTRGLALLGGDEPHAPVATSNTTAMAATRERGGTSS